MVIEIDEAKDIPIYTQIVNAVIIGIAEGELMEGFQLPSVRSLASDLEVNMHTVNKAYTQLSEKGYIIIKHKKGAMINQIAEMGQLDAKEELELALAKYLLYKKKKEIVIEDIELMLDGLKEVR